MAYVSGEHLPIAVVGGFVEVKSNEHGQTEVAILADFAEHVGDINDEAVEKAKSTAEDLRKKLSIMKLLILNTLKQSLKNL